jgi:hypothetical protein
MNFDELKKFFSVENLKRNALISLILMFAGIILLTMLFLLSYSAAGSGDMRYFFQNMGFFFLFTSLLMIYAAVHRANSLKEEHTIKSLIVYTLRRAHIISGALLGSILALFIIALAEIVLTFFGYIPYVGPVMVAILSLLIFTINFALILAVLFVWVTLPPMIGENSGLKRIPKDFLVLAKKRGAIVIGYTLIALAVLTILLGMILVVIRYATGITKAVQWNIGPAYPDVFRVITRSSYISDIVGLITPKTNPASVLRQYGSGIFDYIGMIGNILKITYGIILAAIISFVFSIFFNILSFLYLQTKKGVLK